MPIRGVGGPQDSFYTPSTVPRPPVRHGTQHPTAHASGLSSRGVPAGTAPQRATPPRTQLPTQGQRPQASFGLSTLPGIGNTLARRVGRELAAFVPDRTLSALGFSSHVANRPPLDRTLQEATSLQTQLSTINREMTNARHQPLQLEAMAPRATSSFQEARQTWRALRQTPVGDLLANRDAVKQQLPQLQTEVEQAYKAASQAYPPTHPVWKEAAKAMLMSHVSTGHVYARMAAVNVLGLRNMVATSAADRPSRPG